MPTSSTKATQGSAKSNGSLYTINVQSTTEVQRFAMFSFLNEPHAPVSSRLQNPSYAPGSYSVSFPEPVGQLRPHHGSLAGIGSQFTGTLSDPSASVSKWANANSLRLC
ncbi:hypothetical protein NW762_000393 [Fusarium torreyae]|uniref:Uncharacterized protein n=1 Tax=Fusarium torreyae TaxID=1237075 RepID=A0A9W8SHS8_9HYPO|nr:hypothetical protein NW762_000393 [Fusarium torreyae]